MVSLLICCPLPVVCHKAQSLALLIFLIYINDLPSISKVPEFYLFADDTGICFESDNLLTLQKIVISELRKVRKWLEANGLALNIGKTNYVIFHSHAKKCDGFIRIKLGSKTISRVNSVKCLGILVDSKLTWKPHITDLSKKLARTTGIFFKIRHFATIEISKLLYYSLFDSFISYGISIWGLTHPTNLKALSKLQKKLLGLLHSMISMLILYLYFTDSKYSN